MKPLASALSSPRALNDAAPSLFQLGLLWLRSRLLRDRAARWDHQYATGRWEKLKGEAEQARLDATVRLLTAYKPHARVLEIGCGAALLQRRAASAQYTAWLGIDISSVAIEQARQFAGEAVRYEVADMEAFNPGERFDAIVFTESIYYSSDPARLLRRYARFLNPGGRFFISMFRTKRTPRISARIHQAAAMLDSVVTKNELGTWECSVLRPIVAAR